MRLIIAIWLIMLAGVIFPGQTFAQELSGFAAGDSELFLLSSLGSLWGKTWFKGLIINAALILAVVSYRITVNQIRREERLKAQFERRLSNVEMTALRSQMNPHFIFNCLNSIDYYILQNQTEKASDYLNRFSRLIRLILQNSRSNYVNLKDEIEALQLYIQMESLRFHDQFSYEIEVMEGMSLHDFEIPPMLLQPYVENAIWHGLLHKKRRGRLRLALSLQEGNLLCVIEDNGIGREASRVMRGNSPVRKKSMGMQITGDRINLINKLYDTNASVKIIDKTNGRNKAVGTRVELSIPI